MLRKPAGLADESFISFYHLDRLICPFDNREICLLQLLFEPWLPPGEPGAAGGKAKLKWVEEHMKFAERQQKPWPLPRPGSLIRNEWFNTLTNREQAAASLCICCGSGLGAPSGEVASQT